MSSKTDICNLSMLTCAVAPSLDDVDTDDTNEAAYCRFVFPQIRDLLMEAMPWPFLSEEIELQDIGNPPDGWLFRYQYPTDVKRINKIVNPSQRTEATKEDHIPFKIVKNADGSRGILCDQENAVADVNHFLEDPERYPALFIEPLQQGIASRIARPLRVDAKLQVTIANDFNTWLSEAVRAAQSERQDDPEAESQYVTVRG